MCPCLRFYMGAWDSNSGPNVCIASPLANEPSPRAPQKGGLGCETQALMVKIQRMRKEAVLAYLNISKVCLWDV